MPAILMPGRRHKKLNLLIQFCNSNFHKIIFWNISKQTGFKLAFKISYLATFFSILSYHSPPRPTRAKALPPPPPPPPQSLTRAPQWTPGKDYSAFKPPFSV